MTTSVESLPRFKRRLKRLEGKYRTAVDAVEQLIDQLEKGSQPGDFVPGLGYDVYKERLRNPAARGGKRSGFRVIYYVEAANRVTLLTIYSKTEQADVSAYELRQLVAEANARV